MRRQYSEFNWNCEMSQNTVIYKEVSNGLGHTSPFGTLASPDLDNEPPTYIVQGGGG